MVADFVAYHWDMVDMDNSTDLDQEEFSNLIILFALTDALATMEIFDVNGDGVISMAESMLVIGMLKLGVSYNSTIYHQLLRAITRYMKSPIRPNLQRGSGSMTC